MSIIVYTAVTEGYDKLHPVNSIWSNARFVQFSRKPLNEGWEHRQIYSHFTDPCRNAKVHKILPHVYFPESDYTIWIDGCVKLVSQFPIETLVETWLADSDLAVFKHRIRKCAYEEALVCMERNKDEPSVIHRQMAHYRKHGYPENAGLAECTVLVRRNTASVRRFCETWHAEILHHSRRDQLSFNYVARELAFRYSYLPGSIVRNDHFLWLSHYNGALRDGEEAFPGEP